MTQLSKAAFETTYADASGTFADNTTRAISEGDLRQFADDIADSFQTVVSTVGILNFTVVNIGDWDMDSNATKTVAHGIADHKKIRSISIMIRDDADSFYYPLIGASLAGGAVDGGVTLIDSTNVTLARRASGIFDTTDFNATSYNRGFVTIGYVD